LETEVEEMLWAIRVNPVALKLPGSTPTILGAAIMRESCTAVAWTNGTPLYPEFGIVTATAPRLPVFASPNSTAQ
jgi:hypothetical protein